MTDAALVAAVADGDAGALRELYDRHGAWLHARLIRRCNDPEVVVEVVLDTFVALWKDARRFRHDGEVGAWLWGIAFRRMVSRRRSHRDVVLIPEWDVSPTLQQVMPSAEDQVLLGVEYGDLAAGLRRLSPRSAALTDRDRSIAVIAALVGQGVTDERLLTYLSLARRNGVDEQGLTALMVLLTAYVGQPQASVAMAAVRRSRASA